MSCCNQNRASKVSNRSAAAAPPQAFKSKVEQSILKSTEPITINETKEITANKEKGIWANRCEVCTWKGDLPIQEYPINEDPCPEIINKKSCKKVEYCQEIAIRYLKPPAPAAPGDIIIRTEPNKPTNPAPPVIIRQQPPRPCTPEPLVIREAPPCPPPCIPSQIITISGKPLPPPARKVVVERLAPIPAKPQPVIVERWMPYAEQKRRVIYQQAPPDPVVCKPKNIIVQWAAPDVCVKKDIKHLGVVCANPCDYIQKYGNSLKKSCDLPQFVKDIPPQCGVELAANKKYDPCPVFELCGDVCALNKVDLDKEGLAAYKTQVREKCGCPPPPTPAPCPPTPQPNPCDDQCAPPCPSSPSCGCPSPLAASPCPAACPPPPCPASASSSCSNRSSPRNSRVSNYGSGSAKYASGSASASAFYGSASGSVAASGSGSASAVQFPSSSIFDNGYSSAGYGSNSVAAAYGSTSFNSSSMEAIQR